MSMDNFMDKLVERINSQGSSRASGVASNDGRVMRDRQPVSDDRLDEKLVAFEGKLEAFEEKLIKSFAEDVSEALKASNAEYEKIFNSFMQDNLQSRLSATEELISAQASVRSSIADSTGEAIRGAQEAVSWTVEETARTAKEEILNAISESKGSESDAELLNKIKEELADHMHKESVKVYRNTQAIIEDKYTKNIEEIKAAITEAKPEDKTAGIKAMLAAAIVLMGLNLAGVVTILLWIFRII